MIGNRVDGMLEPFREHVAGCAQCQAGGALLEPLCEEGEFLLPPQWTLTRREWVRRKQQAALDRIRFYGRPSYAHHAPAPAVE